MSFTTENAFLIRVIYLWSWHNFYWSHFSPFWVENKCSIMNSVTMARPSSLTTWHTMSLLSWVVIWETDAREFPPLSSEVLAHRYSHLLSWRSSFSSTLIRRSWLLYNPCHVFPGLQLSTPITCNCFFFFLSFVFYKSFIGDAICPLELQPPLFRPA